MNKLFLTLFIVFLFAIAPGALAQDRPDETTGQAGEPRAAVIPDEQAGVIRFVIDGREQAVLDADGLHVRGSVTYTGVLADGNRYSQRPGSGETDAP